MSLLSEKLKGLREFLGLKSKKSLRFGVLLASTILILSVSALLYSGVTVEKPIEVINPSGSSTTGSQTPGLSNGALFILAILGIVIGLSVFSFAREAYRRFKAPADEESEFASPPLIISKKEEEWEEAPKKDEDENSRSP